MFTGIIGEKGVLVEKHPTGLTIDAQTIMEDVSTGDSIAVNGVCLTVTTMETRRFTVDLMPQTLQVTNLGQLRIGERVNLERALRFNSRLSGHLLTGHVDGTATILSCRKEKEGIIQEFLPPEEFLKYIIPKGSIAIDGVSLTVSTITQRTFVVNIIPHTARMTILGEKKAGDIVNIELDLIGKYIERLLQERSPLHQNSRGIDESFLTEYGFM